MPLLGMSNADPPITSWPPTLPLWFPDTSQPPPTLPRGVGTSLYPVGDIRYEAQQPISMQVRMESLNRIRNEKWRIVGNKGQDYEYFRRAHKNIADRYCAICSEFADEDFDMTRTNHNHFSTMEWRIMQRCDKYGQYYCVGCKNAHSAKSGTRTPLLLTSSTLANWRGKMEANRYEGDAIHIDSIAIPGGQIRDIHRAFLAEYKGAHRPVDVLATVGLNDVSAGHSTHRILSDARSLRDAVLCIPNSSCAFTTLPYPPKLTTLYDNQRNIRRDYTQIIGDVNLGLDTVNSERNQPLDPQRVPKFHTYGTKGTRSPSEHPREWMAYRPRHNDSAWREKTPDLQLHLSDGIRLRMGKAIVKYFCGKYGILPDRRNKWKTD